MWCLSSWSSKFKYPNGPKKKKKRISPVQRLRKHPGWVLSSLSPLNMSIRKGTATRKKLNFKAIWWANISSLLFKFKFYPALKSISLANHYKAWLSSEPFYTSPKRLNSEIYFSRYLCFISQIIGILWWNSLSKLWTMCTQSGRWIITSGK